MRIIKYIEIKEEKIISNVEHINELVEEVFISVPCRVNLHFSKQPKIDFGNDRSLFHYTLKDGKLRIVKSSDIVAMTSENDVVDVYLNNDVQSLLIKGKTKFTDFDHGEYQSIKCEEDVTLVVKNIKKQDFSLSILDNVNAKISSTTFMESLYLTAKGNSKIDAKNIENAYLKTYTSGLSHIDATSNATIEAELVSMSSQNIYGEPTEVIKNISDIGTFRFIENS